jgi:hypothetical protein
MDDEIFEKQVYRGTGCQKDSAQQVTVSTQQELPPATKLVQAAIGRSAGRFARLVVRI